MTGEGTPVHHQEDPVPVKEPESLRQYVRDELGRTLRGLGRAWLWMLTAPGRVPDSSPHQPEGLPQSQEPPPPQDQLPTP